MMGRQNSDQGHLFYEFCLDEAVPDDHLVRKIEAVFDLAWVYAELEPHYPTVGRPSIDPVLMISDSKADPKIVPPRLRIPYWPWCRFPREARARERHRHCSGG
jgi:hypothetical protein